MLGACRLDLAVMFRVESAHGCTVVTLKQTRLYAMGPRGLPDLPTTAGIRIEPLSELPLMLPSVPHGLRALVDEAFGRPCATLQPGAATLRLRGDDAALGQIGNAHALRPNLRVSLSGDECPRRRWPSAWG